MEFKWIKNAPELATTPARELALKIADAGLEAIDTERVVLNSVKIHGDTLHIKNEEFDLSKFKSIKVIGFGKASCVAAGALEKVLGNKIAGGAVIDISLGKCEFIENLVGTHPRPTPQNVEATKHIVDLAAGITKEDLVLVIVSGGGSALLCYPESECEQNAKLYEKFLPTGASIQELNLVRKHLSFLKGGGLAKLFYPATVVGLIFSDVPGGHDEIVASGPTFKDESTAEYARDVLKKYGIDDKEFEFNETPKDDRFFEKVKNITLVSNELALEAMKKRAEDFGLRANIVSAELYDNAKVSVEKMIAGLVGHDVSLAAGETSLKIEKKGGSGGRNLFLAVEATKHMEPGMEFIALASDGRDNCDWAGGLVDERIFEKMKELDLDIEKYLSDYDAVPPLEQTNSLIKTGPTGANISDLMILLKK